MNNYEPEPDVIVDFIFEQGLLYIALINIGQAPAYSVSVSFDREIRGVGGTKLISDMALFHKVEFMPPKKKIVAFIDTSASYFSRGQPDEVETTISFSNRDRRDYTNRITHNLDIYKDIGYIRLAVN